GLRLCLSSLLFCLLCSSGITSHMAQQCFHSEYFDSLLHACKPCRLRCLNPPVPCQPYCNPSVTSSMKGTHIILWTFLGLTLIVSLALFTLMFLLRKMNSDALKDKLQTSGSQNDDKRQFLLERLLDAVKQCQIRFGGRKEIASDSDSRVTCLCAQFEAVLQHGMKRSRGLALTAAAIKQAAGFASKTET
ncbi:hypothetical protein STEG23_004058, partial [Scotinomys teguina]